MKILNTEKQNNGNHPENLNKFFSLTILILYFGFCVLNFLGCATAYISRPAKMQGVYHRIRRKETLWKISKLYKVELEKLVRINKIKNVRKIETGKLIFIPDRKTVISETSPGGLNVIEDFLWPVKGKITSYYGQSFNNMINKGINIRAQRNAPIVAARSGRVNFYSQELGNLGKTVIIDHDDGFLTVYARLSSVFVSVGESVRQGKQIAKIGYDKKDTGNDLHFEIRKGHVPQNPLYYLP